MVNESHSHQYQVHHEFTLRQLTSSLECQNIICCSATTYLRETHGLRSIEHMWSNITTYWDLFTCHLSWGCRKKRHGLPLSYPVCRITTDGSCESICCLTLKNIGNEKVPKFLCCWKYTVNYRSAQLSGSSVFVTRIGTSTKIFRRYMMQRHHYMIDQCNKKYPTVLWQKLVILVDVCQKLPDA